ncbi:hypothetical protein HZU77_009410 [Neisseriaceae bacterium TC5R-5]|nr:hypothetical protein [Neisseriaceae bacterium TC5R-5]
MPSPLASQARFQSSHLCQDLQRFQHMLPTNSQTTSQNPICRRDGWYIHQDYLNGDYDLDPVLASQLIQSLLAKPAVQSDPASSYWLLNYLYSSPAGLPGSQERLWSETQAAIYGPSSALGNVNLLASLGHTAQNHLTQKAIAAAEQKILSGSKSVYINNHITLYNGNKTGKGRPRPRISISNLPIQVVQPNVGPNFRYNGRAETVSAAVKDAKLNKLVPQLTSMNRAYIKGSVGGGILTFGPSLALDLADSIKRDSQGKLQLDGHNLAIASAKSQSGNLVGMFASVGTGLALVGSGAFVAGSAPVILIGLGVGIFVQAIWGATGRADWTASEMKKMLGR